MMSMAWIMEWKGLARIHNKHPNIILITRFRIFVLHSFSHRSLTLVKPSNNATKNANTLLVTQTLWWLIFVAYNYTQHTHMLNHQICFYHNCTIKIFNHPIKTKIPYTWRDVDLHGSLRWLYCSLNFILKFP